MNKLSDWGELRLSMGRSETGGRICVCYCASVRDSRVLVSFEGTMEEERDLWPDSPEDDALVIDEGTVEGPMSPQNSRDRGEPSILSRPMRILVDREDERPPPFTLDLEGEAPTPSNRRPPETSRKAAPPLYDVAEKGVVGMETKGTEEEERRPRGRVCWNCEGGHLIGECRVPRNPDSIARNRRIFMDSRNNKGQSSAASPQKRYHEEAREVQPGGMLTPELRHALGLSGHQLPLHIYRMRVYGYPPGWLEKAKATALPLKVYDPRKDHFFPQGTLDSDFVVEKCHIIEYPGFNVPMPKGFVDEGASLNFPMMHVSDSIEAYLNRLNNPEVLRRRSEGDFNRRRGLLEPPQSRVMRGSPPRDSNRRGGSPLRSPPREDWTGLTSMESLDTPVLNSGARLGCGRGRFRPSDILSEVVKGGVGRGRGGPSNIRPTPPQKKKEEAAGTPVVRPPPVIPPIDASYLPRVPNPKAHPRKSARAKSPSLLRSSGGGGGGGEEEEDVELLNEQPASPVIVNLPSIADLPPSTRGHSASSSSSTTGGSASYVLKSSASLVVDLEKEEDDDDDLESTFDSSATLTKNSSKTQIFIDLVDEDDEDSDNEVIVSQSPPAATSADEDPVTSSPLTGTAKVAQTHAKRKTKSGGKLDDDDDDDTSLLANTETTRNSRILDCIDVESDEYIPPSKKSKKLTTPVTKKVSTPPREVFVEILSSGEEASGGSDWEKSSNSSNKRKRVEESLSTGQVGRASDSETGDEEVESQPNGNVTTVYKKRKIGGDDEDWETEETNTQQQHTVYESTITGNRALNAEFIPANSQLEAMKAMILSASLEEDDDDDEIAVIGEVKGSRPVDKEKPFTPTSLPSFDKFAAGMPPMVFEDAGAAPTGRFDKVLDILRQKKGNRGK